MRVNLDKYLLKVEKPAQYLGNEINSIHKDDFKARMCLFFPDIYEVGMSNLGIRILYSLMNRVKGFFSRKRIFSYGRYGKSHERKWNSNVFFRKQNSIEGI